MTRPLRRFTATETHSALLVLAATSAALMWASSPWVAGYETLWSTRLSFQVGEAELTKELRRWVNDGLMTLMFLVVGLEVTRDLRQQRFPDWRAAALPLAATAGGLVVPALLYLGFNGGGPAAGGWAIVLAGDLALVLGVGALAGVRCPPQLRVLIAGDLVAVTVAGLLHAEVVNLVALAVALELLAVVTALRLLRLLRTLAYLVTAVALWVAAEVSGLHPAIVGLLLGVGCGQGGHPARGAAAAAACRVELSRRPTVRPGQRRCGLDQELLARAVGSPLTLGVVAGLVVGKLAGGFAASVLVVRAGLGAPPRLASPRQLAAGAALTGIGFTVALFVADLTVTDPAAQEEAKVGILAASATAAPIGWLLFQLPAGRPTTPGLPRRPGTPPQEGDEPPHARA